ncbi:hypothetical protein BH09BAC1_BH09BAC1_12610 [soil metagenome]
MSITEAKEKLHQKINETEDETELKWLLLVFNDFQADSAFWSGLTPENLKLSGQYLNQLKHTFTILPETEVLAMLDNWKRVTKQQP